MNYTIFYTYLLFISYTLTGMELTNNTKKKLSISCKNSKKIPLILQPNQTHIFNTKPKKIKCEYTADNEQSKKATTIHLNHAQESMVITFHHNKNKATIYTEYDSSKTLCTSLTEQSIQLYIAKGSIPPCFSGDYFVPLFTTKNVENQQTWPLSLCILW